VSQKIIRGETAAAIAASAERAVHAGGLAPGAALPTIRELAAALKVSPVTVAAAYRLLRGRGLLVSDGRRGTRVRERPPTPMPHTALRSVAPGLVDLANGNPDPALLPPLDTALRALDATRPLYGGPQQLQTLVTFAAAEFEADGIVGEVMVAGGALDAIERLCREYLRPGDRVAVEDPTSPELLDLVAASALIAEPIATDADGPRPAAFEAALRRGVAAAVVSLRGQDPTGAALTRTRAQELKRLLRPHRDVLLIEHDGAAAVAGVPVHPIAGDHPRWAVVRSTSAFLGPDLRVALVAGDALTVARLKGRQALGTRWVSHLLQQVTLALWSDPANGRRLARAAEVYAMRRTALLDALGAADIPASAKSGLNVWIPLREETSTVQALAARGWAVAPGERFRLKSDPGIRVTTSALAPEDARRFASDLAWALRS
jgi:DNA-binding transcriptional MocR family regulator